MSNEFVTAALRFGHTTVTNEYARYNGNNTVIDTNLTFSKINFKSDEAYKYEIERLKILIYRKKHYNMKLLCHFSSAKGGIDSIVMGLVNTRSGQFDLNLASGLQNSLQDRPGGGFIDLAAFVRILNNL